MKLVWCPDTASQAYIDGVRAIAAADSSSAVNCSPELAELVAAMAGGWNAQLIVHAPYSSSSSSTSSSSSCSSHGHGHGHGPPAATSLALAAAARRTGGRYARLDDNLDLDLDDAGPSNEDASGGDSTTEAAAAAAAAAMARLEGVDLLVLDARRRDAAAVLRAARPGPRGMVVVRHGDNTSSSSSSSTGPGIRRRPASAAPWLAAGTRLVRAAYLPIGAGGVEVLHVGVGKGPSLPTTTTTHHSRRMSPGGRGRWIRHVNHRTGEEHVFRRQ